MMNRYFALYSSVEAWRALFRTTISIGILCLFALTVSAQEPRSEPEAPSQDVTSESDDTTERAQPKCPEKFEGIVRLRVVFKVNGRIGEIKDVTVIDRECLAKAGFIEAAIKAAKKIKFEPKRVDGRAVDSIRVVEYSFTLD